MSMITPFPEAESPALARFALDGRERVTAVLSELRDRRTLVTLYYDDAAGFTVAGVADVDAVHERVVLQCAGDASAQRAIAAADRTVAVAFLDGDKIQFDFARAEPVEHEGRLALGLRLPSRVLRIQRRAAPRRPLSGGRPVVCRVPVPQQADETEPVRVLDISIGGLAMLVPPRLFDLVPDQVLRPCRLDLPEVGQVQIALKIRYLEAWPGEIGGRRCGCEFSELGDGARRAVQAYLDRLEAARPPSGPQHAA